MSRNHNVTPREKEVLNLMASQNTTKEIALRLFISTHTDYRKRTNLLKKLSLKNTTGLVKIGLELGLLRLPAILFLIFLFGLQSPIYAGQSTWIGAASDHDWFNPTNWDMGVPGVLDTAYIDADSVNVSSVSDINYLELTGLSRLVVAPAGKLRVLNSDKIAILCSKSTIYNYGLIRVFKPNGKGLVITEDSKMFNYSGARFFIESSGNNSAHVNSGGVLSIFPGALVQIDSCHNALLNDGALFNRGRLEIKVTQNIGLHNSGSLTNEGMIFIDSTGLSGLVNDFGGEVNNLDSIVIQGVAASLIDISPINNRDTLNNLEAGVILIQNNSAQYGIQNETGGAINNSALIMIKDEQIALRNKGGFFSNSGTLEVITTIYGVVLNFSSFINEEEGRMIIGSKDGDLGGGAGVLLNQDGALINYGNIKLHQGFKIGVHNINGRIDNYDSLSINMTTSFDLSFHNQDTFYNHNEGIFLVNDGSLSPGTNVENTTEGYISNSGIMEVNSNGRNGILNFGSFDNDSLLNLIGSGIGIEHQGNNFTNKTNGRIEIQTANPAIQNDSILMNSGVILIENVASAIINSGTLINSDVINVQGICDAGITNKGTIINQTGARILSTTDVPYGIENIDSIHNDGLIFIENADVGILNGMNMVNHDTILLEQNRIGIDNRYDGSIIENHGAVTIKESGEHGIRVNGTIENNGSIQVFQLIEVLSTGTLNNNMSASLSIFWGMGVSIDYLIIQNGGVLNGYPIIEALEGGG